MEPVDSLSSATTLPPPTAGVQFNAPNPSAAMSPRESALPAVVLLPMFPWRLAGAVTLSLAFALIGWEIRRLVEDQPWSDPIMWGSIVAGCLAAGCVLAWTWMTTTNARRLIEPAKSRELPDPRRVVAAWAGPFAFVGVAVGVVAYLGDQVSRGADESASSLPLIVAVIALLVAIPMTYRPLYLLSGMIRQVGGHSAKLSQWMWVPVVLAIVGVGSIVALRFIGAVPAADTSASDPSRWAPLWIVGVVAIAPCVIVVLLAWRAAATTEEAMQLAASRRGGRSVTVSGRRAPTVARRVAARQAAVASRKRVRLIPGVDLLRLCVVTLLAGLALLSVVGAAVMFMFWLESDDGALLPSQGERAWEALDVLHSGARVVGFALIALVSIWTFVAVANVRMTSGRRRNPLIAALSWPAAAVGFWIAADRLVVDQTASSIIVGFAVQAVLLYVPFLLLERAADAVDARRMPLRIAYFVGVVLLVYTQALGGLTTVERSVDTDFGRLTAFLGVGALIQLLSTLAVTEACRALETATEHEAAAHNALVDQRESLARGHAAVDSGRKPSVSEPVAVIGRTR
jgi:hypothetical protein